MPEMKKYHDIVRLGHKSTVGMLNEGDNVVIQEKIDGANASFRLIDGKVVAFSRNTQLDEHNTLRGFYDWVQQNIDPTSLRPDFIYFGEFLVSHKVQYRDDAMNQFYLFDIFDTTTERYLPFGSVQSAAHFLGLNLIHVFYNGPYIDFAHLQSFVGQSAYGNVGEGVVVKNVDYIDRYGRQLFVKLVSESFAEQQKQKLPKDPNQPSSPEQKFVDTYVTSARVDKFLYKLVDEGVIDEQYGMEDMGVILKNLNPRIYDDLIKEESDYLPDECDHKLLRKSIGRTLPNMVKQIIAQREIAQGVS